MGIFSTVFLAVVLAGCAVGAAFGGLAIHQSIQQIDKEESIRDVGSNEPEDKTWAALKRISDIIRSRVVNINDIEVAQSSSNISLRTKEGLPYSPKFTTRDLRNLGLSNQSINLVLDFIKIPGFIGKLSEYTWRPSIVNYETADDFLPALLIGTVPNWDLVWHKDVLQVWAFEPNSFKNKIEFQTFAARPGARSHPFWDHRWLSAPSVAYGRRCQVIDKNCLPSWDFELHECAILTRQNWLHLIPSVASCDRKDLHSDEHQYCKFCIFVKIPKPPPLIWRQVDGAINIQIPDFISWLVRDVNSQFETIFSKDKCVVYADIIARGPGIYAGGYFPNRQYKPNRGMKVVFYINRTYKVTQMQFPLDVWYPKKLLQDDLRKVPFAITPIAPDFTRLPKGQAIFADESFDFHNIFKGLAFNAGWYHRGSQNYRNGWWAQTEKFNNEAPKEEKWNYGPILYTAKVDTVPKNNQIWFVRSEFTFFNTDLIAGRRFHSDRRLEEWYKHIKVIVPNRNQSFNMVISSKIVFYRRLALFLEISEPSFEIVPFKVNGSLEMPTSSPNEGHGGVTELWWCKKRLGGNNASAPLIIPENACLMVCSMTYVMKKLLENKGLFVELARTQPDRIARWLIANDQHYLPTAYHLLDTSREHQADLDRQEKKRLWQVEKARRRALQEQIDMELATKLEAEQLAIAQHQKQLLIIEANRLVAEAARKAEQERQKDEELRLVKEKELEEKRRTAITLLEYDDGKEEGSTIPVRVLVLLGVSGAGKSTFVNDALQRDVLSVGHTLASHTYKLEHKDCIVSNELVRIYDTPGFEDDMKSNSNIGSTIIWGLRKDQLITSTDIPISWAIVSRGIKIPSMTTFDLLKRIIPRSDLDSSPVHLVLVRDKIGEEISDDNEVSLLNDIREIAGLPHLSVILASGSSGSHFQALSKIFTPPGQLIELTQAIKHDPMDYFSVFSDMPDQIDRNARVDNFHTQISAIEDSYDLTFEQKAHNIRALETSVFGAGSGARNFINDRLNKLISDKEDVEKQIKDIRETMFTGRKYRDELEQDKKARDMWVKLRMLEFQKDPPSYLINLHKTKGRNAALKAAKTMAESEYPAPEFNIWDLTRAEAEELNVLKIEQFDRQPDLTLRSNYPHLQRRRRLLELTLRDENSPVITKSTNWEEALMKRLKIDYPSPINSPEGTIMSIDEGDIPLDLGPIQESPLEQIFSQQAYRSERIPTPRGTLLPGYKTLDLAPDYLPLATTNVVNVLLLGGSRTGKTRLFNQLTGLDKPVGSGLASQTLEVSVGKLVNKSQIVILYDGPGFKDTLLPDSDVLDIWIGGLRAIGFDTSAKTLISICLQNNSQQPLADKVEFIRLGTLLSGNQTLADKLVVGLHTNQTNLSESKTLYGLDKIDSELYGPPYSLADMSGNDSDIATILVASERMVGTSIQPLINAILDPSVAKSLCTKTNKILFESVLYNLLSPMSTRVEKRERLRQRRLSHLGHLYSRVESEEFQQHVLTQIQEINPDFVGNGSGDRKYQSSIDLEPQSLTRYLDSHAVGKFIAKRERYLASFDPFNPGVHHEYAKLQDIKATICFYCKGHGDHIVAEIKTAPTNIPSKPGLKASERAMIEQLGLTYSDREDSVLSVSDTPIIDNRIVYESSEILLLALYTIMKTRDIISYQLSLGQISKCQFVTKKLEGQSLIEEFSLFARGTAILATHKRHQGQQDYIKGLFGFRPEHLEMDGNLSETPWSDDDDIWDGGPTCDTLEGIWRSRSSQDIYEHLIVVWTWSSLELAYLKLSQHTWGIKEDADSPGDTFMQIILHK
jgi:predicted GTPase